MSANSQKLISDEQLVVQLQLGNQNAMGELYVRYHMLVFGKCLSFTKNTDDANDLAQDVMIRVMEKIGSFKEESKFSTWLYAITLNYCTDQIRKAKSKYFEPLCAKYDLADNIEVYFYELNEAEVKEAYEEKALASISEEEQNLLIMKYQDKKSIQDLQKMYNLSASAVKMRLKRARGKAASIYAKIHISTAA
jgi:RNA polymerase sigma-70 factor (ECF subfamily)